MKTRKPTILVLAAAGSTGMQVCHQLLNEGFPVKAFVRREDGRSEKLKSSGATIVVGSMADIEDMRRAMAGCQRAYFCAPITDSYLQIATIFATAARDQRLETVVVMSQWLSSSHHPALQTRLCWLSDQVFSMLPDTDVITVNPGFFADNELQSLNLTAIFGTFMIPYGTGLNAAPSNEDMARVISTILAKPEGHEGKTYRITGPKLLSPTDIASILSRVLERKVRYVQTPTWMIARVLQGYGYDSFVIAQFLEYVKEYQRGTFAIGAPNDAVFEITGKPAEDYESTARRYAAQLPANTRSWLNVLKTIAQMNGWMLRPSPKTRPHLRLEDFSDLKHVSLSIDSEEWRESHQGTSGTTSIAPPPNTFIASRPLKPEVTR